MTTSPHPLRSLIRLVLCIAASLAIYGLVFGVLLGRPMTRGIMLDMLDAKLAHAAASQRPQLYVLAGSNARFSHSCATLQAELGAPCTNMGVAAGMGIDTQLDALKATLIAGDVIYVPMEYGQYDTAPDAVLASAETGERFFRDAGGLLESRGAEGLLHGFFFFDLSYGLQATVENVFAAMGGARRFGLHTMNAMGDETGHDGDKALTYRAVIEGWDWKPPALDTTLPPHADAPGSSLAHITAFLEFARARGVTVIGGLPTTFDDAPVPEELIDALADLYHSHGAEFLLLDNRAQYPRRTFYDTSYHLTETAAKAHSKMLAERLRAFEAVVKLGGTSAPDG